MKYNLTCIRFYLLGLFLSVCALNVLSQKIETQFNGFGHLEFQADYSDESNAYFAIGEHDFFVNSQLTKRITFLGEYVIRFNGKSATSFLPSIERSLLKFNYYKNHNLIVGKIHTPLNYWNDTYHHGRLFFPTIDRPLAFSYIIPLHTLGMQIQGQNLGKWNFGYDFVVGNGINNTDIGNSGVNMSYTAAIHFKPIENLRIGISHFYENMKSHLPGAHSGHSLNYPHYQGEMYTGPMQINLTSVSLSYFGNKLEFLNEASYNQTYTDSLGAAHNWSAFAYLGFRVTDNSIPYIVTDFIKIAENDLFVHQFDLLKFSLGYRHEFSHLLSLKAQAEYLTSTNQQHQQHQGHSNPQRFGFRIQFAYGF
jgi:hypothetical protein